MDLKSPEDFTSRALCIKKWKLIFVTRRYRKCEYFPCRQTSHQMNVKPITRYAITASAPQIRAYGS